MATVAPKRDRFEHLQGKVRFGVCQSCLHHYPEDLLRYQDGIVVCPDDWEENGRDITRQRTRDEASAVAAEMASKVQPPRYPYNDGFFRPGVGAPIAAVTDLTPEPITLLRGGPAVGGTLTGVNLTNADALAYGHAGITDASAPVWDSATQVTLSLQASGGMPEGLYYLDYNLQRFQSAIKVI